MRKPETPMHTLEALTAAIDKAVPDALTFIKYVNVDARVLNWLIADSNALWAAAAPSAPASYGPSLRQYFAAHAPIPTMEMIADERRQDTNRNPNRDPNGHRIRSEAEIIASFAFSYADAMIAAEKGGA